MRKKILALAAAFVFTGAGAQTASTTTLRPEIPRHLDPTVVSLNKELPRGDVVSHDSKVDAVRRTYGASKYLQPLTEWTRAETDDAVIYRTRFKVPFEWIDRQQFLYVGRTSASFDVVINGDLAAYSQTGTALYMKSVSGVSALLT